MKTRKWILECRGKYWTGTEWVATKEAAHHYDTVDAADAEIESQDPKHKIAEEVTIMSQDIPKGWKHP